MEEILGRHNDDHAFARFLADWRDIMALQIEQATAAIGGIPGVTGLILAGSNGIGQPWPLSDIDLIPIYADAQRERAIERVEQVRLAVLDAWSTQGWRAGLDVGRLNFGVAEVATAFAAPEPDPLPLLRDDRWYHSIDKAYGGALIDRDGRATRLVDWFTANRFAPEVVVLRLQRSAREACASLALVDEHIASGDRVAAFSALLKAIQWLQIRLMEGWGERDNSLGRFGTRFRRAASVHGKADDCDVLDSHSSLDDDAVHRRLEDAPAWVHERGDRSWQARRHVGEELARLESDCEVLRVCAMYELRVAAGPPYAAWLEVPEPNDFRERADRFAGMLDGIEGGAGRQVPGSESRITSSMRYRPSCSTKT